MPLPDLATILVAAVVIVVIASAIWSRFAWVTIYEYQQGLRYRDGWLAGTVGPGRYFVLRTSGRIVPVDMRASLQTVPGQELVTSDGVTVRISLAAQQRVKDAVKAIHEVQSYQEMVYGLLQIALREVIAGMTIDEVLAGRSTIGPEVHARTVEAARAFGIELESVAVRDLMLPAASKRIFGQVVEARQRGLAALEKARGETAALRSLANAARMVEANPSLLQLRMLQQLEGTSGNTVLLGMPANSTPVPIREVAAGAVGAGEGASQRSEGTEP